MTLIDDYLREFGASLRAEADRKRQIVDELRAHLLDKARDVRAERPGASEVDVHREVLADLGDARDLALAYEPEGAPVLKNAAGEIVLRLGEAVGRGATFVAKKGPAAARAVGRGTGRVLKALLAVIGVLLVVAIAVAVWAVVALQPLASQLIEESIPVYSYSESCSSTPCSGTAPADMFFVPENTTALRVMIDVTHPWRVNGTGNVTLVFRSPDGAETYNRTFQMQARSDIHQEMRWDARPGNWTVAYVYDGFVGSVDITAYLGLLPWTE